MKAAFCLKYGPPEVLQIREIAKPVCSSNKVLVKVMATSVNSGDVRVRALAVTAFLKPIMRLVLGFSKPRNPILGNVFSGVIEQVGPQVKKFKPGEKVFGITGLKFGTYAEYVCIKENSVIAAMPVNASFEEAAALPFGWHTAIYFLRKAKIERSKKQKVLIYGSTGSVGAAATQLAKYYDAVITTVCSSKGKDFMERLGVEDVICYDQQDFTKTTRRYDIIFDAVGKTSRRKCRHLLKRGGRFVTVGGLDMASENEEQLSFIQHLFEQVRCKATIDRIYPFNEIVAAHRYVDSGHKKGNVVVTFR